ncbi:succinylglutamate desuccinylase/aspartoacylase family protein [Bdellovibrio sp. 22V]|uniref:M14 family zinc carboxypeptidase n=1 Tax=Bdellovibrio sp. 22V TaxID=3044166 RepID=UPI002542D41A|nr:M14 family zinc carboxypeptidase [Bdellovibrio sp. 22V]WII70836.1 succinylglutamate desuccinylase/aspartoacylase family protein [Bdellovibrio sp. 22V]
MKTSIFTTTSKGMPVIAYEFHNDGPEVLILGGVHGDEIEGVIASQELLKHFMHSFPYKLNLTLVPQFNFEGVIFKTRGNGNGVDLNRNLPTKDWSPEVKTPRYHPGPFAGSENENKGLMAYLEQKKPVFILSLHSWHPVLNVNGDCRQVAEVLAQRTGYKIDDDIGYPTPGCLGTYTGLERNFPTLTYEIERGLSAEKIIEIHVPAILESLKVLERK